MIIRPQSHNFRNQSQTQFSTGSYGSRKKGKIPEKTQNSNAELLALKKQENLTAVAASLKLQMPYGDIPSRQRKPMRSQLSARTDLRPSTSDTVDSMLKSEEKEKASLH